MSTQETIKHLEDPSTEKRELVAQYEGPIPPASEMAKYENALPGTADRILAMSEKEATHRHKVEGTLLVQDDRRITHAFIERILGQIFALIMGVFAISAGAYVALKGYQLAGGFIGGGGVIGLVTAFIWGRKKDH